ncbi:hypothetical protein MNBD_GAMMA07-798 [hydrothermal vent metagenome]|uniref:Thiol:disulfide interchange protein DsbA n=1 Tax=hydrothermal vent metagenome TaxID=652676 RepID=A0A3B0WNU7_9ZZZZ
MKTDFFNMSKTLSHNLAGLAFLGAACLSVSSQAMERYSENGHYQRVVPAQTQMGIVKSKDKIDVVEFFLYSCLHCYRLEPKLAKWVEKNKDKVSFRRIPAVITPQWVALAKAYYIAEELGILDKTHDALFKAIVEDKKIYLSAFTLAEFFVDYGVDRNKFKELFNSKKIVDKVSDARILSAKYKFRGVPIVVVNDEFKTAPFYVKDQEQMIDVMDFLVVKSSIK